MHISYSPILREHYESQEKFDEAYSVAVQIVESGVRQQRNLLLIQSDWTQANDSPLTSQQKQAWATYRQELRDLLETSPLDFTQSLTITDDFFPQKPE